jgi:ferredoxin
MSTSSRTDHATGSVEPPSVRVDRVACTGHGICATLLPGSVQLDEWGYPVVLSRSDGGVDDGPEARAAAVRWCPAMALYVDRRS